MLIEIQVVPEKDEAEKQNYSGDGDDREGREPHGDLVKNWRQWRNRGDVDKDEDEDEDQR